MYLRPPWNQATVRRKHGQIRLFRTLLLAITHALVLNSTHLENKNLSKMKKFSQLAQT
jgi:hypothetical protein